MSDAIPEPCPQRDLIEAFASDKVDESQRGEAEALLQRSEPCREYFRQLTAGRFPRLPNYTIIGQVGKGGFGVVYKAVHHAKERTEALKVLFSKTPLLTEYFQNEVHLIARLRHPNIATLFDAQLATPPLYYTMEFVEGERLNDYLKRPDVTLAERINIIQAVAGAVGYAHNQGVVHRDLKPQNILIDHEGQARVVDFGISIKLAEVGAPEGSGELPRKSQEGPVGTLGYIAPEQEKGGVIDARADIFSLGALLFHCVTGEAARLATIPDQRLRALRERKVVQPEDINAIIGRAVAADPDDRYRTCEQFSADLENYLAGRMIQAREKPSLAYMLYRAGTLVVRDAPFTVRTAVLVLIAGFLTWWFWAMEARAVSQEFVVDRTVMIGLTPDTLEAVREGVIGGNLPGLDPVPYPGNKTWRMLYGELLKKIAVAEPRVVMIDSHLSDCAPEPHLDAAFIEGMKALRAPVIIGAVEFAPNGDPIMCQDILEVVRERGGFGTLMGVGVDKDESLFEVNYCIQRGLEQPIPGLAVAAFAAWRHPDCRPELQIETDRQRLVVKYRKRTIEAPGESRYQDQPDTFDLQWLDTYDENHPKFKYAGTILRPGDVLAFASTRAHLNQYWQENDRTLSFEQILTADDEQVRRWLNDRAIVIGQMLPGLDHHLRKSGEFMYGCQLHAEAIEGLMSNRTFHRFNRPELAIRNFVWCGVGVILAGLPRPRRWQSLRTVMALCLGLFILGAWMGAIAAISRNEWWVLEVCIAFTGIITAGALTFLTKAARERQMSMTPGAIRVSTESPTLASTLLAETR